MSNDVFLIDWENDDQDQDKEIYLNCNDYKELLMIYLEYVEKKIKSFQINFNELKSESTLKYLINLIEVHQLFIVKSQFYLDNKSTKQQEYLIAFGTKQILTKIILSNNENNHLDFCIYNCHGNKIYCSHLNNIKDCLIEINSNSSIVTQMIGGYTLLNQFLYTFQCRLNRKLYEFILKNCYYITIVYSEFNEKDFLFSLIDELLFTNINNNLDDEVIESLRLENPAKILSNLYLSSINPAQNFVLLKQLNINFILNLTGYKYNSNELRYEINYPSEITILHIKIDDEIDTNIINYFNETLQFINNSIKNNNLNRILIHCEAGISRSATIVIAYLMKYMNKSLKDAYQFVKIRKTNIAPNISFFKQLIQFEKQLNQNLNSSIYLNDYIIEQMSEGIASTFSRDQIIKALEKTNYDINKATHLLFK